MAGVPRRISVPVYLSLALLLIAVVWLVRTFKPEPPLTPHLTAILESGVLRVATVNSPLTYFNVQDRVTGLEYDLARDFAERLEVRLEMVIVGSFGELFEAVTSGRADLAAASITATPERARIVRFGPSYQEVSQQVVYRAGSRRPRTIDDLTGMHIRVIAASSYEETLRKLSASVPGLTWEAIDDGDIESIFSAIADGQVDVTLADSNVMAVHQRFFPELRVGFSLEGTQQIAWALPQGEEASLIAALEAFFADITASGRLQRVRDRHQAHLPGYDRVNTHYLRRHIQTRLPSLLADFQTAASRTGFDWKLLAAMAYQESHWDPAAVSRTGVRGVMMLTQATAAELGVEDREDPRQSILAGARYLARMRTKIPARIEEPDRTWMALAAYNVGWGHLEDARVITQRKGRNPDRWRDVAEHLPLLSDPAYHRDTRFGYARGREPVRYVQNIRSYYDILSWTVGRGGAAVAITP